MVGWVGPLQGGLAKKWNLGKLPETSSSKAAPQDLPEKYKIYQRRNQVAGIGMGRGICWFYVQKSVKQEDWEFDGLQRKS